MSNVFLFIIYLLGAAFAAFNAYLIWFNYDLYRRIYGQSETDVEFYAARDFFRRLFNSPTYRVSLKIGSLLFLLLWLIGIPILLLNLASL